MRYTQLRGLLKVKMQVALTYRGGRFPTFSLAFYFFFNLLQKKGAHALA